MKRRPDATAADAPAPPGGSGDSSSQDLSPFADTRDHLLAELERIDLLIASDVAALRGLHAADEQFRGLYISESEIDALIAEPRGTPRWLAADEDGTKARHAALEALAARIDARKAASRERGVDLRLPDLQDAFGLDRFETDALLVCLAVELDLRYERIYAYLQDDVTRKRPSVALLLDLLLPDPSQRLAAHGRFGPAAPLVRLQLLEVFDDPSQPHAPLLAKGLKVADRVVAHLFGSDDVDERLRERVTAVAPAVRVADLVVDDDTRRGLVGLAARSGGPDCTVVHLRGAQGSGRRTMVEAVCAEAGRSLVVADVAALVGDGDDDLRTRLALVDREARLRDAIVYWSGVDVLFADVHAGSLRAFAAHCDAAADLLFVGGEEPWPTSAHVRTANFWRIALRRPPARDQTRLWQAAIAELEPGDQGIDVAGVAARFRFSIGQIRDVVAIAKNVARWRDPATATLTTGDLDEGCRLRSNQKLGSLAQKIRTHSRWADIVLPEDRLAQLREVCNQVRYRELVYGRWGFDRKLAMGKGLAALFSGPSGTGKTMAADIVASELGIDLYKIDLSSIVSKYIGETEKNLSRIFSEAETSNAILFFDEADALFGKRSEVRDSHDRYANIEVGYLLQRIEEYEGVVLLATNFRRNMDEAFVRRLHFAIDFPLPGADDRLRIWTAVWPSETPVDPDVDLAFMARKFEVAGGNIRNIALTAAFLAADDGGLVRMRHVVGATQREFQKMGKLVSDGDFRVDAA